MRALLSGLIAPGLLAVATLAATTDARAGELQLDLAVAARRSTWRGDFMGGGQLGAGYRFARILAVDFVGWTELATVDKRANTGLTFGVTGAIPRDGVRPTLRLYFIHQHEEGLVSIEDHPIGTTFGVGAGIRHRAGGGARVGVEVPFDKRKKLEWVALFGLDTTWFPDTSLGPGLYVGLTAGVGFDYAIEELP